MNDTAARFAEMITEWDSDRILDYFARAMGDNAYGERNEEIAIVRAEIHRRMV